MTTTQPTQIESAPPASNAKSNANLQSVGTVLLSVVLGAIGQLILKTAVNQTGALEISAQSLLKLATNPVLILGLGVYGVSAILWLLALTKAELSFAYPFLSLTYVAVLLGGALLFQEHITLGRICGFGVILVGLLVIASGEKAGASNPGKQNSA